MIRKDDVITLIKKLETSEISGEKVMIDFESGKYFMLKGVANDIWDYIQKETTPEAIINQLLEAYEVEEAQCEEAVVSFLQKLENYQFIKVSQVPC